MKYIAIALLITVSLGSCKKDSNPSEIPFEGYWELRSTFGFAGLWEYEPGNGDIVYFDGSSFKHFRKDQPVVAGTYGIVEDNTVEESVGLVFDEGRFSRRIAFVMDDLHYWSGKVFFEQRGDKLELISGYFPLDSGSRFIYRKIADPGQPD